MPGEYASFAMRAVSLGRKRGRPPVLSANAFYPFAAERRLASLLKAELARSVRESLASALGRLSDDGEEDGWTEGFLSGTERAASEIVLNAREAFSRFSEMTVGTPYYPPDVEARVKDDWKAEFLACCRSADADAKADIARALTEAKERGWNRAQAESAVLERLDPKYAKRAELIARTETGKLNNAATMATYRSAGVEYYVWLATPDERTRPSHAALNGKICAVGDPDSWYEDNPDDPLRPVAHGRGKDMYHGDPGTDFQCRCTSIPWDPRIDSRYGVREVPEPERKPSELETAREEAESAKRGMEEAEAAKREAERKLEILRAANARHAARTQAEISGIRERWERRVRHREILALAVERHAKRTKQKETAILVKFRKRTAIRANARAVLSETEGIAGIGREALEAALRGGNAKSYRTMESLTAEIAVHVQELKSMKYVENPVEAAKKYGFQAVSECEKSINAKIGAWSGKPDEKLLSSAKFEAQWVEDKKKYPTWPIAKAAYEKVAAEAADRIKWSGFKAELDAMATEAKAHPKSAKLAAALAKLEQAFNAHGESEFEIALKEAKKAVPKKKVAKTVQSANTVTNEKFGVSAGKQKLEMPAGMPESGKIECIRALTGTDARTARSFGDAVKAFSYQWDWEIRQVQSGNTAFSSKHGHSIGEIRKKAEDLEKFIAMSPKWEGGDTYRGLSLSMTDLEEFRKRQKDKIPIDMRGSASWSTDKGVSENFAGMHAGEKNKSGETMTEKAIFVKKGGQPMGTSIRHLSRFSNEHEILCSEKARYTITGYRYDSRAKIHYFTVE